MRSDLQIATRIQTNAEVEKKKKKKQITTQKEEEHMYLQILRARPINRQTERQRQTDRPTKKQLERLERKRRRELGIERETDTLRYMKIHREVYIQKDREYPSQTEAEEADTAIKRQRDR